MLKTRIVGPNEYHAKVDSDGFLYVTSKEYYSWENEIKYFTNDVYGRNLNIDASPSASTTENIYDGGDNTYWTASIIQTAANDFDLTSTGQNHTPGGSQSFEYTGENDDIAQWERPSGDLDLTDYDNFTGWVYVINWPDTGTKEILFYGYDTDTGLTVGNEVDLANYINVDDTGVWQPFTISLSDMGLTGLTINAMRTQLTDIGTGDAPTAYIDDLKLEGSTQNQGPVEYFLRPNNNELLQVNTLNFTFVREYDSSLSNGTMYGLAYNDILGYTLTNGILYRRFINQDVKFSENLSNIFDLISLPDVNISDAIYDGSNTLLKMIYMFREPVLLKHSSRDYISLRLLDDFSSFAEFRVSTSCRVRNEGFVNG